MENVLESILIDITFNKKKYVIGSVYRCIGKHPTLSTKDQFSIFNDLLSNLLDNLSPSEMILGGDFNLDVLKIRSCRNTEAYINNLFSNGCLQIVSKPTRCNNLSATCIDHYVTNIQQSVYNTRILLSRISDHFPILFTIDSISKNPPCHNVVTYRDFSEHNVRQFVNSLMIEDWNNVLNCNDPNDSLNNFLSIFKAHHTSFFSPKTKRFNKNFDKKEKWMTSGLLVSRLKKLELSKLCSCTPSPENSNRYKSYRNMYNRLVRISRKSYYEEQLTLNKNNLRKTWQILNDALNISKNKQTISRLMVDNILIDKPTDIANKFNCFFTSIASEISSKINPCPDNEDGPPTDSEFVMSSIPITHSELSNALNELQNKKSTDLNDISMYLVKTAFTAISSRFFTYLINLFNKV
jgi:hypothetical protein